MEEGRAKVTAGGGVTRQAVAGYRSLEAEVELLSAEDVRKTVVAGGGVTRKATAEAQSSGTEGNLHSVKEWLSGE